MSLLHNEDFTIWQLRSSYLSTIKDGIGDRLINVNDSVLNTPGFRAAGWSTASAFPNTHSSSHLKRTYSPPIPTTANVSSEYYKLAERNARPSNHDLQGLGMEDGDDDGGMVTGKSHTEMTARRHHARNGKKKSRRERQQEVQRQAVAEEDDSSDLSDDSDDDEGDNVGSAVDQIKFHKMPIRRDRADSSPRRSEDQKERPEVMITSPSTQTIANQYNSIPLRPRRDTTTSSDLSTDNETDHRGYKSQVSFSGSDHIVDHHRRRRERTGSRGAESLALGELHEEDEEDSGAESVVSAISSDFDNTAGSGSLLLAGVAGGLNLSSPMVMMNKLPPGTGPQNSSHRKSRAPAPTLQDLPPPRPISMVQPVSLLTSQLKARKRAPSNPVDKFVVLSGRGQEDALYLKIYAPFSSDPEDPLDLPVTRESKLAEQPAPVTVAETIGLALWKYSADSRGPALGREKLTVNRWTLRMVDDGEVEYDFPALGRTLPMTDFTSNNNQPPKARQRTRGKPYDEFALVEASKTEFEENEKLYPQFSSSVGSDETDQPANLTAPGTTQQPTSNSKTPQITPARANPILGQPFSSALNHSTLTPADRPAVPTSHATPRMGVAKTLKIRFINTEASAHVMTINTSTDSYIAEILDSVCKRWGQDKGNYLLKVMGSNTIAPLDRTVEALGSITELDLVRRRFGGGPLALGTSPGSSSPNAPLMVESTEPATSKKAKKEAKKGAQRMLPSASQKQDHLGGYYRRYHVFRKQPMSFTASNHRILTFENDYMHIVPGDTGKTASGGKTRSISFSDVIGSKVSRRHPKSFRVMIVRGNDATEQKRYDFEARSTGEADEIVSEIKKNMAHYRI